jgi:hypothetical protein
MNSLLLVEHWASMVRDAKDSEKTHGVDPRDTERLLDLMTDFARYTRFRQYNLFTQQRGEEFDLLLKKIEMRGFSLDAARRLLQDETLWSTLLEVAELG